MVPKLWGYLLFRIFSAEKRRILLSRLLVYSLWLITAKIYTSMPNKYFFEIFEDHKLNYRKKAFFFLIHLFARDVLVMKKLEIEKTKPTFTISVLEVEH